MFGMMWRSMALVLVVVAFPAAEIGASDADLRDVTLFFTGMVQGNFEPCG